MSFIKLQQFYKSMKKGTEEENSVHQAREEGFEDFEDLESEGSTRANKIMEAVKRKNSYKDDLNEDLEKATYDEDPYDTAAVATALVQKKFGITDFSEGSKGAAYRDYYASRIEAEHGPGSYGQADWKQAQKPPKSGDKKGTQKMMQKQGLSPALAAALGWAFSGDVGRAGQMTSEQSREWERTLSAAERRQFERAMRSKMRKKSVDKSLSKDSFDALKTFYSDSSDEYIKRSPKSTDFLVEKEHSVLPPRQGLMWDAVKHRWTRPENIGHTVTEVQGKKRFRGTGTGVHERSVSGQGSGKTRMVESGRRFKGAADTGALRPHEAKSPAGHPRHKKV